jgi:flagellar hook-associated protein 2
MASITSSGLGSGLDIKTLVQQLVDAERTPQTNDLDTKEANLQAQLSAYGSLKSATSAFEDSVKGLGDLSSFQNRLANTSDSTVFTASATSSALSGSYSIEVANLATAQKLTSTAFASGEPIGTGTLTLTVGGKTMSLELSDTNNSLDAIRDAINNAKDNPGVSATVVKASDGNHLILTATDTGSTHNITVTTSGGDGNLSRLVYDPANSVTNLTQAVAAGDASIKIEGFTYTSPSNTITDAIAGVTLNLVAAKPGTTLNLAIAPDTKGVLDKVNKFISSYNGLLDTLTNLSKYDPNTKQAAPLVGDSIVRSISSQLRRQIGNDIPGISTAFNSLTDIGITADRSGKLSLDQTVFNKAAQQDFNGIGALFAGSKGISGTLQSTLDSYVTSGGIISARTDGIQGRLTDIDNSREALDRRMTALQNQLLSQFSAMDSLVGQLQNTGSFLTQNLNAMNNSKSQS